MLPEQRRCVGDACISQQAGVLHADLSTSTRRTISVPAYILDASSVDVTKNKAQVCHPISTAVCDQASDLHNAREAWRDLPVPLAIDPKHAGLSQVRIHER
jgi:hypothetical protein